MENSPRFNHVYFIGIGGVGMSGLAMILKDRGVEVSGSDLAVSPATRRLAARGVRIYPSHDAANIAESVDLVVYSSAIPADNPERRHALARGIRKLRRGEFLAEIAGCFPTVAAVAGSHGKTTTTAMIAHILRECNLKPGYIVGGEVTGWPGSARAGGGGILVTEVDESDGTQALVNSSLGVILNIDDDHCWNHGGIDSLEACFADFARKADQVIAWNTAATRRLLAEMPNVRLLDESSIPPRMELALPGPHNRWNAAVAIEAAVRLGVGREQAMAAVATFQGVGRRMTIHYTSPDGARVIVEDYAHHPTELEAVLGALREKYPSHLLHVTFQPHRFERIKRYAGDFSRLLSQADGVAVYETFAAWLGDADIADARTIADAIAGPPVAFWQGGVAPLVERAAAFGEGRPVVHAVIGAGDVQDVIPPLRAALVERELLSLAGRIRIRVADCEVRTDTPWGSLTTLGIGKGRPLLARPSNAAALAALLGLAREHGLPVRNLGRGSNLVGSDQANVEIVMALDRGEFTDFAIAGETVRAGSGCSARTVLLAMMEAGRLAPRFAKLAWIPGTVGGMTAINAGAGGVTMCDLVLSVEGVLADGSCFKRAGDQIKWSYRGTDLPEDLIITGVALRSEAGDPAEARRVYQEHGIWRRGHQPQGRSAGSVFRNAGASAAGALIDRCGLKGLREGACAVASEHANFILAEKGASEEDFAQLAMRLRLQVFETLGVNLCPEVVFANPAITRRVMTCVDCPTVTVLKGGPSRERLISLASGAAVAQALREAGLNVHEVEFADSAMPRIPPDTDVVFPVLHGTFGEDGQLQTLLEQAGWPYVGSGPEASRIAMAKSETKHVLCAAGIPTAPYRRVVSAAAEMPADMKFPLIVKPDCQGSSFGMTKLDEPDPEAWRRALEAALAVDSAALVEQFVRGREITVGILAGQALPVVEIVPPSGRVFDYDAKYDHTQGHTHYLCPPENVPESACRLAAEYAVKFYDLIGARDMLRVDFIVDEAGIPWCLEGNSIPGFTATSLLPKAALTAGIAYPELCARLVRECRRRTAWTAGGKGNPA